MALGNQIEPVVANPNNAMVHGNRVAGPKKAAARSTLKSGKFKLEFGLFRLVW
jgi:hypothetical protein